MDATKDITCCVTGHRDIPENSLESVLDRLRVEIISAIDDGYTHFISGFARGIDLIFASIVAELKAEYDISLEAAIPYDGRMNTPDTEFHALIAHCDRITILSDHYSKKCFAVRNRYMIDRSQRVIAVYDGRRKGGTAATLKYASTHNCEVKLVSV